MAKNPGTYVEESRGHGGEERAYDPPYSKLKHVWRNTETGDYLAVAFYDNPSNTWCRYDVVIFTEDKIQSPKGVLDRINSLFKNDKLNANRSIRLFKDFNMEHEAKSKAEQLVQTNSVYDYL